LILEVGAWVLHQSASDYRDWMQRGVSAPRIAVNVSPLQLRHPDFITMLEQALGPEGESRAALDIEITEGVLMDKTDEVIRTLNSIRQLGVHVAIDDFGTGYSSLRYLARLPIDTLKIDRSFVTAMTDDADDMAIVSSIISLAHGLDLDVVAEGVETEEELKLLRLLRCDQMQGYLFSRPVAKEALEQLLRNEAAAEPCGSRPNPEFAERRLIGRSPATRR
jgi:EAL domain-containing protein (putative c-di-GMP-specific phosphodiesterase class I)